MKKRTKIIISVIIGILIVFVAANIVLYNCLKNKSITSVMPKHTEYVQIMYGYAKCMEMAELSDMPVDAELKEEIKQSAQYIYKAFEDTSYDVAMTTELVKLAYIYTYFEFDMKKLEKQLEKYFIEEENLFNGVEYLGEDSKTSWYISDNVNILMDLGMSNRSILEEFNVQEGMINWFNSNIENDYKNDNDMTDYYTYMGLLYNNDMSRELNISILEEELNKQIEEIYSSKDEFTANIFDVSDLTDVLINTYYLGEHDVELLEEVNELYGSISTREDFGYDIDDKYGVMIMSYYLRGYYEAFGTINNDYLEENLDEMIKEHYDKYCKGKIDK